tara:strand:- start:10 stop:177 length:168 start_codon:yes stop_codon:yes gene_type:complete
MAARFYRVEELCTDGWSPLDQDSIKLTKEQASKRLEEAMNEGLNPNRLRAVPHNV